eukprot:jgi/Bigna1/77456/fgenesh1_pg.48_\
MKGRIWSPLWAVSALLVALANASIPQGKATPSTSESVQIDAKTIDTNAERQYQVDNATLSWINDAQREHDQLNGYLDSALRSLNNLQLQKDHRRPPQNAAPATDPNKKETRISSPDDSRSSEFNHSSNRANEDAAGKFRLLASSDRKEDESTGALPGNSYFKGGEMPNSVSGDQMAGIQSMFGLRANVSLNPASSPHHKMRQREQQQSSSTHHESTPKEATRANEKLSAAGSAEAGALASGSVVEERPAAPLQSIAGGRGGGGSVELLAEALREEKAENQKNGRLLGRISNGMQKSV